MMHSETDLAKSTEQQLRITIAFLALAWFFILLRVWTRTCIISSFGWDDSTMILASVSSPSSSAMTSNELTTVDGIHCVLRRIAIHRSEWRRHARHWHRPIADLDKGTTLTALSLTLCLQL
jgi:hypothetical protein